MTEVAHLEVGGRRSAYRLRSGASPTLLFFPGYASDMEGTKALALDAFAERRGLSMLRFDYSGTGSSSGSFEDGTLALWLEESLAALDQLTEGPLIVVGSSMGGWVALHLALLRPDRIRALISFGGDPLKAVGDPAFARAGFDKLDLLVSLDCRMNATAEASDYVIATSQPFERHEISIPGDSSYPVPFVQ